MIFYLLSRLRPAPPLAVHDRPLVPGPLHPQRLHRTARAQFHGFIFPIAWSILGAEPLEMLLLLLAPGLGLGLGLAARGPASAPLLQDSSGCGAAGAGRPAAWMRLCTAPSLHRLRLRLL